MAADAGDPKMEGALYSDEQWEPECVGQVYEDPQAELDARLGAAVRAAICVHRDDDLSTYGGRVLTIIADVLEKEEAVLATYQHVPWMADGEIIPPGELSAHLGEVVLKLLRHQSPVTLRAWADMLSAEEIYGLGGILRGLASALEEIRNAAEEK